MRFFYFTHSARLLEFRTSKLLQVTFTKISMFNYKTAEYSIQERPGVLAVTRAVRELFSTHVALKTPRRENPHLHSHLEHHNPLSRVLPRKKIRSLDLVHE